MDIPTNLPGINAALAGSQNASASCPVTGLGGFSSNYGAIPP
jgi:hypothetical protein